MQIQRYKEILNMLFSQSLKERGNLPQISQQCPTGLKLVEQRGLEHLGVCSWQTASNIYTEETFKMSGQ